MFLNVGLTNDHAEVVCAALHLVNATDLAHLFVVCNELQTILLNLLLEEMFSTRSDMVYWERFRKGSPWEIHLSRLNSRVFNWVFPRPDNVETLFNDPTDLIHYIESLRGDFHSLAVLLAKVNHAGSMLKKIYQDINHKSVFQYPTRSALLRAAKVLQESSNFKPSATSRSFDPPEEASNTNSSHLSTTSQRIVHDVIENTERQLRQFLIEIAQAIGQHMPNVSLFEVLPSCTTTHLEKASIQELLAVSSALLEMLQHHPCLIAGFPLGITHLKVRRPSYLERHWIRNILASLAGIYLANTTFNMIQTGELQRQCTRLITFVKGKVQEHVVEPVTDLALELFDTIRKREDIVSREDLEASRAALNRMLVEFSQSKEGSALILSRFKEELLKQKDTLLETIKNNAASGSGTTENVSKAVSKALAAATTHPGGVSQAAQTTISEAFQATPEQAWEALMSEYEKELQTPIRGIVYGNLFTAMLIQMQKLKVHTEAAMLTMDQILASNELTIAATAAMPALIAFGLGISWLRSMLQPKAQTPGTHTLHFRLILCDVERSLLAWQAKLEEKEKFEAEEEQEEEVNLDGLEWIQARAELSQQVQQAQGIYAFHMARLRSKFHEMFDLRSPNAELRVVRSVHHPLTHVMVHTTPNHVTNLIVPAHDTHAAAVAGAPSNTPQTPDPVSQADITSSTAPPAVHAPPKRRGSHKQASQHTPPTPSPSHKFRNASGGSFLLSRSVSRKHHHHHHHHALLHHHLQQQASFRTTQKWPLAKTQTAGDTPNGDSKDQPISSQYPSYQPSPNNMSLTPTQQGVTGTTGVSFWQVWFWTQDYWQHSQRVLWQTMHSLEDFLVSAHWLLWGNSNESQSSTTVYNSLEADLLLLESPPEEVSVARKMEVIRAMRVSYKCLSPVN